MCKINSGKLLYGTGLNSLLCDDLEMVGWGGREVHEGGDLCIHIADTLCCRAETKQYCKTIILQLKKKVWKFLKKLEIELPYDSAIPLLGIHTEETRIERDTCTPMFIAALFIIARTWKQPRCPSADEWIRKLWYIHTMEYYSAIKKNVFESVLMRWMKLEPIYRVR